MTGPTGDGTVAPHRGLTVIRPLALRRVAEAAVAEAAGVRPAEVAVELSDERGELAISVATPLDMDSAPASGTLVDHAVAITAELAEGVERLTARKVGRVKVRLTRLRGGEDDAAIGGGRNRRRVA